MKICRKETSKDLMETKQGSQKGVIPQLTF